MVGISFPKRLTLGKGATLRLATFSNWLAICTGWTLLIVFLSRYAPPKVRDLRVYYSFVFPLPFFAYLYLVRFRKFVNSRVAFAVCLFFVVGLSFWIQDHGHWIVLSALCLLQVGLLRFFKLDNFGFADFCFLLACWNFFGTLYWLEGHFTLLVIRNGWTAALVLVAVLVWVSGALLGATKASAQFGKRQRILAYASLLLLALPHALYVPGMDPNFAHHWGFYAGSAALVREGGWLLHEIPSQYGFLDILTIALLPFRDTFQSLFWLQAVLYLGSAFILFSISLRIIPRHALGILLSLVFTIVTVFYVPGWLPLGEGPTIYPSIGPIRFLGVQSLLLLALVMTESLVERGKLSARFFLAGHLIWCFSVLWSFECGVYCTAVWFPCFVLLLALTHPTRTKRETGGLLLVPIVGISLCIAAISVYYKIRLGVLPDALAYIEYAIAFAKGYGYYISHPQGPGWVLIFVSALQLFAIFHFWVSRRWSWLPLLIGAFCTFWVMCSYFATRSHEANALNLFTLVVICLFIVLRAYLSEFPLERRTIYTFLVPFLVVTLGMILADPVVYPTFSEKWDWIQRVKKNTSVLVRHVEPPEEIPRLLKQAGALPTDRLVWENYRLFVWPGHSLQRFFLPIAPSLQFSVLSPSRQQEYLERWMRHLPSGATGFVISNLNSGSSVLSDFLGNNFVGGPPYREGEYQVRRFTSFPRTAGKESSK
jgi:hypothetical protein